MIPSHMLRAALLLDAMDASHRKGAGIQEGMKRMACCGGIASRKRINCMGMGQARALWAWVNFAEAGHTASHVPCQAGGGCLACTGQGP